MATANGSSSDLGRAASPPTDNYPPKIKRRESWMAEELVIPEHMTPPAVPVPKPAFRRRDSWLPNEEAQAAIAVLTKPEAKLTKRKSAPMLVLPPASQEQALLLSPSSTTKLSASENIDHHASQISSTIRDIAAMVAPPPPHVAKRTTSVAPQLNPLVEVPTPDSAETPALESETAKPTRVKSKRLSKIKDNDSGAETTPVTEGASETPPKIKRQISFKNGESVVPSANNNNNNNEEPEVTSPRSFVEVTSPRSVEIVEQPKVTRKLSLQREMTSPEDRPKISRQGSFKNGEIMTSTPEEKPKIVRRGSLKNGEVATSEEGSQRPSRRNSTRLSKADPDSSESTPTRSKSTRLRSSTDAEPEAGKDENGSPRSKKSGKHKAVVMTSASDDGLPSKSMRPRVSSLPLEVDVTAGTEGSKKRITKRHSSANLGNESSSRSSVESLVRSSESVSTIGSTLTSPTAMLSPTGEMAAKVTSLADFASPRHDIIDAMKSLEASRALYGSVMTVYSKTEEEQEQEREQEEEEEELSQRPLKRNDTLTLSARDIASVLHHEVQSGRKLSSLLSSSALLVVDEEENVLVESEKGIRKSPTKERISPEKQTRLEDGLHRPPRPGLPPINSLKKSRSEPNVDLMLMRKLTRRNRSKSLSMLEFEIGRLKSYPSEFNKNLPAEVIERVKRCNDRTQFARAKREAFQERSSQRKERASIWTRLPYFSKVANRAQAVKQKASSTESSPIAALDNFPPQLIAKGYKGVMVDGEASNLREIGKLSSFPEASLMNAAKGLPPAAAQLLPIFGKDGKPMDYKVLERLKKVEERKELAQRKKAEFLLRSQQLKLKRLQESGAEIMYEDDFNSENLSSPVVLNPLFGERRPSGDPDTVPHYHDASPQMSASPQDDMLQKHILLDVPIDDSLERSCSVESSLFDVAQSSLPSLSVAANNNNTLPRAVFEVHHPVDAFNNISFHNQPRTSVESTGSFIALTSPTTTTPNEQDKNFLSIGQWAPAYHNSSVQSNSSILTIVAKNEDGDGNKYTDMNHLPRLETIQDKRKQQWQQAKSELNRPRVSSEPMTPSGRRTVLDPNLFKSQENDLQRVDSLSFNATHNPLFDGRSAAMAMTSSSSPSTANTSMRLRAATKPLA